MPAPVYRVVTLLSALAVGLPIGTNLDVFTLLWLVSSGGLLDSRGAVIPGLSALGLDVAAVQRTWAALGHGAWTSARCPATGWAPAGLVGEHRARRGMLAAPYL